MDLSTSHVDELFLAHVFQGFFNTQIFFSFISIPNIWFSVIIHILIKNLANVHLKQMMTSWVGQTIQKATTFSSSKICNENCVNNSFLLLFNAWTEKLKKKISIEWVLKLFHFSQRNDNKHKNTINVLLQYFSPLKNYHRI